MANWLSKSNNIWHLYTLSSPLKLILRSYKPHSALQCFIKNIVLWHCTFDKGSPLPINPFPPQPYNTLFFYPYDKLTAYNHATNLKSVIPASNIVGPQLKRVDLQMNYNMLVILVNFNPSALYRFLKIPMHELIDQPVNASDLLGSELASINQRLSESSNYDEMIALIQKYLLKKIDSFKETLPIDRVLQSQFMHGKAISIEQLADLSCVSTRQLERQFNERIGMPPKLYFRLGRFSKAWNLREWYPNISWSAISHRCGYADQMHMIRDFKEFAGVTPGFLQSELEKTPLRLQRDGLAIL